MKVYEETLLENDYFLLNSKLSKLHLMGQCGIPVSKCLLHDQEYIYELMSVFSLKNLKIQCEQLFEPRFVDKGQKQA